MPTSSDLVTDLPADFEVFGQAVATSLADLLGGTTGQVLAKASNTNMDFTWSTLSIPTVINPNLVINGNFTVNQRGYVSAANLASGAYGFDRWKSNFTNTTLTFTSAPAGQIVTINSGGGLQQIVEQANVPAGTYVLSFTGTATGRIYNSGATPPSYAASPISFTADGLANVVVEFTATGSTKTLGEVKLEEGTTATAFSYAGGTLEGELAACQRYYVRFGANTATPFQGFGYAFANSTSVVYANVPLPVEMRTTPTTIDSANAIRVQSNVNVTISTIAYGNVGASPTFGGLYITTPASLTAGNTYLLCADNNNTAFIGFSAEL
jgi:hypothetical protein